MDDKKKILNIAAIVSIFLCGCPGLLVIIFGATFSQGYDLQQYGFDVSGDPQAFTIFGTTAICLGVLMVLLTIVLGVLALVQARKKKKIATIGDVPPAI